MPELYELVNTYKPDIVWSDGDAGTSPNYWNATEFIAWYIFVNVVNSPLDDTVY